MAPTHANLFGQGSEPHTGCSYDEDKAGSEERIERAGCGRLHFDLAFDCDASLINCQASVLQS